MFVSWLLFQLKGGRSAWSDKGTDNNVTSQNTDAWNQGVLAVWLSPGIEGGLNYLPAIVISLGLVSSSGPSSQDRREAWFSTVGLQTADLRP